MKLFFCPITGCHDVVKMTKTLRTCECGGSSGKYINDIDAEIYGAAVPLGFANSTFVNALINRPMIGAGKEFVAFVIPTFCTTIIKK